MGLGRLLLFPLWALLLPAAPDQSVQHSYKNVKLVQLSLHPTAAAQISSAESPRLAEAEAAKDEEKALNDLVGLLQDMVKNIPTQGAGLTAEPPTVVASIVESPPSPSEAVNNAVWVSMKPAAGTEQVEALETVASAQKSSPSTTTAFWKLRNDKDASVVLHSDRTSTEKITPENVPSATSTAFILLSDNTASKSLSLSMDKVTAKEENKSFDQVTNGALANLVDSLKNVKKLSAVLDLAKEPAQESTGEEAVGGNQHKPGGAGILDLIDMLIGTIQNAPSSVQEDPALHKYIEIAENYLKNALELASEAEKKLKLQLHQEINSSTPASLPELQTEVVFEVLSTLPSPPPEPQTEVVLQIATPSASSPEPQTEVVLEIATPSASSPEPQTEVVLEIPTPSASSPEPQTEVVLEIATPSASSPELQTEVVLEIPTPSASSPEPQTEVVLEIATPSASSPEPQTEVVLDIHSTPSTSSPEPQTEVVLDIHSTPSTSPPEPQTEVVLDIHSTPSASPSKSEVTIELTSSSPVSLEKTAEDVQVEMGKLKAFINLLYGFSPQLTMYTQNLSSKEASKDIVERAMAVVDAIKDVFCGNKEAKSKKILKQLLKEDLELVKQAMKTKRVS